MFYEVINQTAMLSGAVLVSVTALIYTLMQGRTGKQQNKVFIALTLNILLAAVCNIIRYFAGMYAPAEPAATLIVQVSHIVYYMLHNLLAAGFGFYIITVGNSGLRMDARLCLLYALPCAAVEMLILTNPWHHGIYSYDARMLLVHNHLEWIIYAVSFGYIFFAFCSLLLHISALTGKRRHTLFIYFGIMLIGMVIQMLNASIKSELLAEALALIGIMLFIEKEDGRMDAICGIYNRSALKTDLENYFHMHRSYSAVCIRLTNHELLMRLIGANGMEILCRRVCEYLKGICPWYELYHAAPAVFMLVKTEEKEQAYVLAERIRQDFADGLYVQGTDTPISATVLLAHVPEELTRPADVMQMSDVPLPKAYEKDFLCGEQLSYLTRSTDVENAIERGILERRFQLYFQTVHELDGLKLYAVKALLRLSDPLLGDLMPGEFIPIAERTGQIHRIGMLALEQVCDLIRSGIPDQLGLQCINVNLAFVQCMQPDFAEHVMQILESYHVPPAMINFEITKPLTRTDYDVLEHVVGELKKRGFQFSMEDFGAGYSNVESVFALDFDVVKVDKSVLWAAAESEFGRIILLNSIRMIRELKRKILVEGVENEAQVALLEDLGVDYLQGYYFSRPMSRAELERFGQERTV